MSKSRIIRNLIFSAISMAEIYAIFGKKYLTFNSLLATSISFELGNQIHILMQENNAGGTTPYNPLKIPAKNITPAHH